MLSTVGNRTPAAGSTTRRRSGRSAIVLVPATGVVLVGAEDGLGAAGGAQGVAQDARLVLVRPELADHVAGLEAVEPVGEATELAGGAGRHRAGGLPGTPERGLHAPAAWSSAGSATEDPVQFRATSINSARLGAAFHSWSAPRVRPSPHPTGMHSSHGWSTPG